MSGFARRWFARLALALACATTTAAAQVREAVVVAVHDGDTITVRASGETLRIRLAGIDCPELGQPFSRRAKQFTAALVFGQTVTLSGHETDRYGRLVARVAVHGADVSLALARNGLAWLYDEGPPDRDLTAAERSARAAHAGLWSDPDPMPPWRWRSVHGAAGHEPLPTAAEARGPFRGNTQSHLFHRPGCANYACRRCTAVFTSAAEAIAAGYTPAHDCLR